MKTSMKFGLLAIALLFLGCPATVPDGNNQPQSFTIYFYNADSWSAVNAYAWNGGTNYLGAWPGSAMTAEGGGWYKATINGTAASNIIFNNGTGSQTPDLYRSGNGYYFMGSWYGNDPRENAPAVSVDFGNASAAMPVGGVSGVEFNVNATVVSALALSTGEYSFGVDSETPMTGSLSSGNNAIDLLSLAGWDNGETATLMLTVENANGSATVEYDYIKQAVSHVSTTAPHSTSDPWVPMGAFYDGTDTWFRLWSPDSANVKVSVSGASQQDMTLMPAVGIYKNVYQYSVAGDQRGQTYRFFVNGTGVRDPYGYMIHYQDQNSQNTQNNIVMGHLNNGFVEIATTLNGTGTWSTTPPALTSREDSIIYEVHIRDASIDSSSGVTYKGKYLGLIQSDTVGSEPTVLDHFKDLGVTHLQLLPMYDFRTQQYNWGYDPQNWNIPEEQYSSENLNDYQGRVDEVRAMVSGLHSNGLRVVMDVVYNHTAEDSMFNGITTKYYTGRNDSGTGNGINTAVPMVSRLIRDSLDHWVGNYGMDGFRFDLMGIFHYEAVEDWGIYLNTKYSGRNLLLYGEPWNGYFGDPEENQKVRLGTIPAIDPDAHIGVFNGEYRESIKGNNDGTYKRYMFGTANWNEGPKWWGGIAAGSRGSVLAADGTAVLSNLWDSMYARDPEQTINYISAHDNFGLWDKVYLSLATGVTQNSSHQVTALTAPDSAGLTLGQRVARFGMGIVLTSQGIPFIHGGDELLRTKTNNNNGDWTSMATSGNWWYGSHGGTHNTYNSPDGFNSIKWGWRTRAENAAYFDYMKDLIALRKAEPLLRLTTRSDIVALVDTYLNYGSGNTISASGWANDTTLSPGVVVNVYGSEELMVVYNPTASNYTLPVSRQLSGTWHKIFGDAGTLNEASHSWSCDALAVTVFKKQ